MRAQKASYLKNGEDDQRPTLSKVSSTKLECHRRPCVSVGVDQAVLYYWQFVDFRWSVEISWRMGLLEEQDGDVVGVFLPLPFGPASGPLSILNAYFRLYLPHLCSGRD